MFVESVAVTANVVADFHGRVVLLGQFVEEVALQFLECVEWGNDTLESQFRQTRIQGESNAVAFRFVLANGAKRLFLHVQQDNRASQTEVQRPEARQDGLLREHGMGIREHLILRIAPASFVVWTLLKFCGLRKGFKVPADQFRKPDKRVKLPAEEQQGAAVVVRAAPPEEILLVNRPDPRDGQFSHQVRQVVLPVVGLVERIVQVRQETCGLPFPDVVGIRSVIQDIVVVVEFADDAHGSGQAVPVVLFILRAVPGSHGCGRGEPLSTVFAEEVPVRDA